MYATIQKWGNSQGLRLPKPLLDSLGIRENDRVELRQDGDAIVIRKLRHAAHWTLEERLTSFYGKPLEEIGPPEGEEEEVSWGRPEGGEAW